MEKLIRETTQSAGTTPSSATDAFRLSPAMVERASDRLCWVSLICAVTAVISFGLHRLLQPEVLAVQDHPGAALNLVVLVLFSAGLVAVQKLKLLPANYILILGLFFEVLVAWCISYFETVLPLGPNEVVRGVSMVAVWLAFVTLLVRHTPATTLAAGIAAGAMWPLAYYVNLKINGYEPLPFNRLAVWLYPIVLTVACSYYINRRVFKMELRAHRAEELGAYTLDYKIGQGGMGEVWRARHRLLARDAAIKIIRPELTSSSARQAELIRRRFEREALATASLRSPHTVYLFDFGVTSNGSFYYVMELLNGVSLRTLVEQFGPVPASRVIYLVRQACLSLEEAHRSGMVHRDIKPTNIYTCKLGVQRDYVKVLDFGLVKRIGPETTMLTQDGSSAGTPAFMAPEAAMGIEKVDGRLDIYSLGCVAYYLLTGKMVFDEPTSTAVALAHVQKEPVPPSRRTELPIPAALEDVVMRCLAKKPEDRPRSAQEVWRLLGGCPEGGRWDGEQAAEWWRVNLPEGATEQLQLEQDTTLGTPARTI